MTLLVNIGCPDCGRKITVYKRGLDRYVCEACNRQFTQADVLPVANPTRAPNPEANSRSER